MEKLYKDVKVTRVETCSDSIDYKVEIEEEYVIFLRKCQAYTDYEINPMYFHSYRGKYEVWEGNVSHEKNGILHFYPNKTDILLEE